MKHEYSPAYKFRNTMGHGKIPHSVRAAKCVRPTTFKDNAIVFLKEE